jgi:hypothetical protein
MPAVTSCSFVRYSLEDASLELAIIRVLFCRDVHQSCVLERDDISDAIQSRDLADQVSA